MAKKLITVGVSFFNSETTICKCIDSVLRQTYDYFELILINDASTDDFYNLITPYLKDKRITYISNSINKGVAHQHNQIAKLSNGIYIAKLDADDYMTPDRLKIQYEFMEKNSQIDLVSSLAYISNRSSSSKFSISKGKIFKNKFSMLLQNNIIHSTVFARAAFFEKNLYDEQFIRCQDLELWLRTFSNYSFERINEPLVFYQKNENKQKYLTSIVYLLILLEKYKDDLTFIEYYFLKYYVTLKKYYYKFF